jgi:hypothetical protein
MIITSLEEISIAIPRVALTHSKEGENHGIPSGPTGNKKHPSSASNKNAISAANLRYDFIFFPKEMRI